MTMEMAGGCANPAQYRITVDQQEEASMRGLASVVGGVVVLVALAFAVSPVGAGEQKLEPSAAFKVGVTLESDVVTVSPMTMKLCADKKKKDEADCKENQVKNPNHICISMCGVCCGKALKVTNTTTFTIPKGKVLKILRKSNKALGGDWKNWTSVGVPNGLAKGASMTVLGGCEQSECVDTGKYLYKVETGEQEVPH